jgi:hypothetical protein
MHEKMAFDILYSEDTPTGYKSSLVSVHVILQREDIVWI